MRSTMESQNESRAYLLTTQHWTIVVIHVNILRTPYTQIEDQQQQILDGWRDRTVGRPCKSKEFSANRSSLKGFTCCPFRYKCIDNTIIFDYVGVKYERNLTLLFWKKQIPLERIMKPLARLIVLISPLLFAPNVASIRNLFLPRNGEISISSQIADNLSNVTNFESLLGAGRTLAYPFSAGVLLSIATLASENNWKVSDTGFSKVLGIPQEEIVDSYGALLEMLETDDNVTLSNTIFSFRRDFSPSEALVDTLMTEVREASWTRETWKETYRMMTEHLGNVTNEKIDTLLIPSVTKVGTPYRRATEAVLLSTFHYINTWQYPWTEAEVGKFLGNEGIPYLKLRGNFLIAQEDEFTAVSVPLEGGSKSVVFVLPHVNLTSKILRNGPEDEDDEHTDVVPFPTKWQVKNILLKVPAFNTTDVDQYGSELNEIGMNETFCTILRDFFGKYPFYLRPMVQVNFLDFNEDFLELASATGVAVERFQSLFSIPPPGAVQNASQQLSSSSNNNEKSGSGSKLSPQNQPSPPLDKVHTRDSDNVVFSPVTSNGSADSDILILSFDRPFLWYLNDSDVGPMFFGTVENLINPAFPENSTEPGADEEGNTTVPPGETTMDMEADEKLISEIEKFFLWSCRSFALSKGQEDMPLYSTFDVDVDVPTNPTNITQINATLAE
ncbi:Serpin B11 [Orchesella cincta]|uniref:Serpin B11 n=1 Tax=Orchesella cincta TaxID=48709 RepID=A0A1D2NFG6_ORCCI|nr:Serpin B11 [Orchesella cincta]